MTTRIAFLRAVNVGKRTVRMARAIEVFEALGYTNVSTYINSGNVVFEASGSRADLERTIGEALEAEFGFEVTTFVRTAAELARVLEATPFKVADTDTYLVTFLTSAPSAATARELESFSNEFDTLVVIGREVHWRMHGKSTDTRLKKQQWKVAGVHSTSRNIKMLRKLGARVAG